MPPAKQLQDLLGPKTAPVAVSFRESPPANVPHVAAADPPREGVEFFEAKVRPRRPRDDVAGDQERQAVQLADIAFLQVARQHG